jgi:hypothetical protein
LAAARFIRQAGGHIVAFPAWQLPAVSAHAAVSIYRCYGCDHVVAERA